MKKITFVLSLVLMHFATYPMNLGYGGNSTATPYQFPTSNTVPSSSFSYESIYPVCITICAPKEVIDPTSFSIRCQNFGENDVAFLHHSNDKNGLTMFHTSREKCIAEVSQPCESISCREEKNAFSKTGIPLTCAKMCFPVEKKTKDPEIEASIECYEGLCVARFEADNPELCKIITDSIFEHQEKNDDTLTSAASTPSPGMGIFVSVLMLGQLFAPPLALIFGLN